MNSKVAAIITEKIVNALDKGVVPWQKPWMTVSRLCVNRKLKPYSLLNHMLLEDPGEYITYKQATAEGGHVKKGAEAKKVLFFKMLDAKDDPDKKIPYLVYYNVFNVKDVEGIEPKMKEEVLTIKFNPVEEAEKIIKAYQKRTGIRIVREKKGNEAFFNATKDYIRVPAMEQFNNPAEYYSTLFHEMIHSTGHKSRLNRFTNGKEDTDMKSESYSKEELVAEVGAASLLAFIGIDTESSFNNSASYINTWKKRIQSDKNIFVYACNKAEKAIDFILGKTEEPVVETVVEERQLALV